MNTKETRKATVEEFLLQVKTLLKENLVGITTQTGEGSLQFRLPNGQCFEMKISETEKM